VHYIVDSFFRLDLHPELMTLQFHNDEMTLFQFLIDIEKNEATFYFYGLTTICYHGHDSAKLYVVTMLSGHFVIRWSVHKNVYTTSFMTCAVT